MRRDSLCSPSLPFYTVAILLKDDYFVSGAGLPGRFKAEQVEFHWGHSNGSAGSEHSINGRRFPVEVRTGRDVKCRPALGFHINEMLCLHPQGLCKSNLYRPYLCLWKSFIYSLTGVYSPWSFSSLTGDARGSRGHHGLSRLTPSQGFSTICFI